MTRGRGALAVVFTISMGSAFGQASAADPLGFYLGGAIGQSHVRADEEAFGSSLGFDEHHNAWKLLVGLRPISLLGAEFEYVDFGHPSASLGGPNALVGVQAGSACYKAAAALASFVRHTVAARRHLRKGWSRTPADDGERSYHVQLGRRLPANPVPVCTETNRHALRIRGRSATQAFCVWRSCRIRAY